jgi:hypothetical protein
MHTNGHIHDDHIDTSAGYETRDIALNTLIKWIVGLYIFIFFTIAATVPLYFILVPRRDRTGQNERRPTMARKPPEPMLQSHPIQDIGKFEVQQKAELGSYGRIAEQPGKVHIPVEQAIEHVLAQGLPAKAGQAPPPPSGIYTPGDTTAAWSSGTKAAPGSAPQAETPHGAAVTPIQSPAVHVPAAGQPATGKPTAPGPVSPPSATPPPGPITSPGGVTESEMRGSRNENTPAPRRDEPR